MTQSLRIKTYFSSTVEAAVALARHELGDDAMLMNSRPAPTDALHLGRYEVVFATHDRPHAPEPLPFQLELEENGVESRLIHELLEGPTHTRESLALLMSSMIATDSTLPHSVALIGPAGRGKTSTILKLALTRGGSAHIFSSGSAPSTTPFAGILGMRFHNFESAASLNRSFPSGGVFIDIPNRTPQDFARCLAAHGIPAFLVLRADASAGNLAHMVERYSVFQPQRLIFTGLDETETFGSIFSAAARSKLPVSFLSSGPRIPEDLEPATAARLVDMVLAPAKALEMAA